MTSDLKPSEVLDKAADLITPEGAWTQGAYWRAPDGSPYGDYNQATCWCASGAIGRAGRGATNMDARQYLRTAVGGNIFDFNDAPERTQPEVIAALRKAAELARSEGS